MSKENGGRGGGRRGRTGRRDERRSSEDAALPSARKRVVHAHADEELHEEEADRHGDATADAGDGLAGSLRRIGRLDKADDLTRDERRRRLRSIADNLVDASAPEGPEERVREGLRLIRRERSPREPRRREKGAQGERSRTRHKPTSRRPSSRPQPARAAAFHLSRVRLDGTKVPSSSPWFHSSTARRRFSKFSSKTSARWPASRVGSILGRSSAWSSRL